VLARTRGLARAQSREDADRREHAAMMSLTEAPARSGRPGGPVM